MSTVEKTKLSKNPFKRTRELIRIFLGEESNDTSDFEAYKNGTDSEIIKILEDSITNIEANADKTFNQFSKIRKTRKIVSKANTPIAHEHIENTKVQENDTKIHNQDTCERDS